jgi:hypothetical protein
LLKVISKGVSCMMAKKLIILVMEIFRLRKFTKKEREMGDRFSNLKMEIFRELKNTLLGESTVNGLAIIIPEK